MRPLVDVLMPYRPSSPHRERVYRAMRKAWQWVEFPVRVVVGVDGDAGSSEPFNLSRAANRAFRDSTADYVLLHGTDHIPPTPTTMAWAVEMLVEHPWVPLYAGTRLLNSYETEKVIADVDAKRLPLQPLLYHCVARMPHCTGIMMFRRSSWQTLGGMDERFFGWGCEDTALRLAAESVFGKPPLPGGDLTTLWHPPAPRDRFNSNAGILAEYITAHKTGKMSRYLDQR